MKRIITGGTGLIGQALVARWHSEHELIVIGRDRQRIEHMYGDKVTALTWDEWQANPAGTLEETECIINLAGTNIGGPRWTSARKQEILDSRVNATNICTAVLAQATAPAPRLLNASAIGIYGMQTQSDAGLPPAFTETSNINSAKSDFLTTVARAWETAARGAGTRTVILRFGIVLSRDGGALPQMAQPFYFGLGGRIGTGKQVLSWITLHDLCRAIDFILLHPELTGVLNLVAPQAVTQATFANVLAATLQRHCWFAVPSWMMKLLLGEMAMLVLEGNHVIPERLQALGFTFDHDNLTTALRHIYRPSFQT